MCSMVLQTAGLSGQGIPTVSPSISKVCSLAQPRCTLLPPPATSAVGEMAASHCCPSSVHMSPQRRTKPYTQLGSAASPTPETHGVRTGTEPTRPSDQIPGQPAIANAVNDLWNSHSNAWTSAPSTCLGWEDLGFSAQSTCQRHL